MVPTEKTGGREKLEAISAGQLAHEIRRSRQPILVFFHAEWCRHCRQMMSLFAGLDCAPECMRVFAVDVEKEYDLVLRLQIKEVPSLVMIRDGRVNTIFIGLTWRSTGDAVQRWVQDQRETRDG